MLFSSQEEIKILFDLKSAEEDKFKAQRKLGIPLASKCSGTVAPRISHTIVFE